MIEMKINLGYIIIQPLDFTKGDMGVGFFPGWATLPSEGLLIM